MKKRLKGLLAFTLSLVMVLSLNPVTASAAGTHNCGKSVSDCLVCEVAELINALPAKDDINVNNAAAVTEQIHAIDRIKVDLTDDEYDELLTKVTTRPNQSGYGLDEPVRYMEAVEAVTNLKAGGSLAVGKKYAVGGADLDWAKTDAVISVECLDAGSSFAPLSVTLADIAESSLDGFYSATADGWMNRYILPAGTYKITETGYHAVTKDGANLTTTATYEVDGNTTTDYAIVTVEEGESSVVYAVNRTEPFLKVSNTVISDLASDADAEFDFTVVLDDTNISDTYGDMEFINGVATFSLKDGQSAIAKDIPANTTYTVVAESPDYFAVNYEEGKAEGTIEATGSEVAFTHTRKKGNLTVTNTVIGADAAFEFTVTLDAEISGTYGDMIFTDGVATFTLRNGESKTAEDLPAGMGYSVSADNPYNYTVTDRENYNSSITTNPITVKYKFEEPQPSPTTYTVSFDANGGSGTMANVTDVSGDYTLPTCTFTAPAGKQFKAWSVGGTEYAVGATIAVSADTAVTAVWKNAPVYWGGPIVTTPTEPITSAKTSDPIALSVAVTILSATGSAWLMRKKDD